MKKLAILAIGMALAACGGDENGTGGGGGGGGGGGSSDPCDGISGAHSLTWEAGGTLPVRWNTAAVSVGDVIAVLAQAKVYAYDPQTAEFTELDPPARPREGPIASDGEKLYLVGGHEYFTVYPDVEVYDFGSATWSSLPDLPEARTGNNALVIDGLLYSFGGETTVHGAATDDVWAYDLADGDSGVWGVAELMPRDRGLTGAVAEGGLGYLAGGAEDLGATLIDALDTLYVYEPVADEWITGAVMPNRRAMLYNGASLCGALYLVGGRIGITDYAAVDAYDLASETWYASTDLTLARSSHGVAAHQGKLYVFGGYSSAEDIHTNTVEIGTPDASLLP